MRVVGCIVGEMIGTLVGLPGKGEGLDVVGMMVGVAVGKTVGGNVLAAEGAYVGTGVGTLVGAIWHERVLKAARSFGKRRGNGVQT